MTSLIGKLAVALQLETAAFERGAKRAAAETNALGTKMEKGAAAVGKLGGAVVAAGAVLAGSALLANLRQMVTQGLEYASALGEQAQQLGVSTKALQEYRHIATQVGVEQGEMDAALAKLTRTMGDAVTGNKAAASAFERLGIDIKAFVASGGDAGDLIPVIAEKMKGLGSDSERASALVDLFGKSGQKLAPLMAEGAKGIEALRREARELGIVLSDKQIQQADATADKIAKFQNVFNIRIAGVVADNANAIGTFAERLATLADRLLKLMGAVMQFENSGAGRVLKTLTGIVINPAGTAAGMIQAGAAAGSAPGKASAAPVNPGKVNYLMKPKAALPAKWLGATPSSLRAQLGAGSSTFDQFGVGGVVGGLDAIGGASREARREAEASAGGIKRTFVDMADSTVAALDRMAGAIRGGGFLGVLSAGLGLVTQLGSIGLFGKAVAGRINAPRVPAYAGGTNFHPGGLALVGERGPELVNLPRGAKVWPNGSGPGGGNTYHITGNLLTPEFWQQIRAGDIAAADAGGRLGASRIASRQRWALR